MSKEKAILALEDGTIFEGISIGASGQVNGEIVFNTSMTGYQEILTDPSYAKQIVTLTYPHIGNTGTNREDTESDKIWCSGLVIRSLSQAESSWRNTETLSNYLIRNNIQGISNNYNNWIIDFFDSETSSINFDFEDEIIQSSVLVYDGKIKNERFQ